jgi:uncharacterized membrane protein YkvA (DUF1232 family)
LHLARRTTIFAGVNLEREMRFGRAATMSDSERQERDEAAVRHGFWRKVGQFAAAMPFTEDLLTGYYCAFDRQTPAHVRAALVGALTYFIAPFDILPDLLPVVGLTDDAAVLAAVITLVWDNIQPVHRTAARAALARLNEAG